MSDVTRILSAIHAANDPHAAEELLPLVYDELRRLAASRLARERPGQTLSATSLVHEAYLRLIGDEPIQWDSRGHFFAAAAEAMRRILVDQARKKNSLKAGGNLNRVDMADSHIVAAAPQVDVLILDEALNRLAQADARKAQLVKLRFFAGMTLHEAAQALGISDATADADWAYAKSWLKLEMES